MNINRYIDICRQKRAGKSFAFLAERCATSEEAPYRIQKAKSPRPDESCVLVLAGTGGKGINLRGYNGMLKKVDNFIKNNPQLQGDTVRVCVAVCDFGKYHLDKVARKGLYYEADWPQHLAELKYGVPEKHQEETFNPAYIRDIFEAAVLPRISAKGGKERLSRLQALQNIRRLNIVAHCHGGYVAMQLEKMMDGKMSELGYSLPEQKELKSQLLVLSYNPDCPKHQSGLYFVAVESAQDCHNEYQTYVREWLLMAPKDFGVCYLPKVMGRTLMCSQIDKFGVEGNPARPIRVLSDEDLFWGKNAENKEKKLGEHEFMGFEPVGNMSKGALKLQSFANNILQNAVENSRKQGGSEFVPLPKIQNLATLNLRQKYEFARAAATGYHLLVRVNYADKSRIDDYANWRRSLPTVTIGD